MSGDHDSKSLSSTETVLAALWCEVLQTTYSPTPSDDFFSLGGDSMSMVLVELRIKEELSVDLPPGVLIMASTLKELAAIIDQKHEGKC